MYKEMKLDSIFMQEMQLKYVNKFLIRHLKIIILYYLDMKILE